MGGKFPGSNQGNLENFLLGVREGKIRCTLIDKYKDQIPFQLKLL